MNIIGGSQLKDGTDLKRLTGIEVSARSSA
jgi:hypothetical protein